MKKYRISKYSPQYRDENGCFTKKEWTSYSDIGNEFCGETLTLEKYIQTEKDYIKTVKAICEFCHVQSLKVRELEKIFSIEEIQSLFCAKGLKLAWEDILFMEGLTNGQMISMDNLARFIALILKDCYWCKLVSVTSDFCVEFGYDLYIYITCNELSEMIIQQAYEIGIYIDSV